MNDTTAYFDASNPDTIAGMTATVAANDTAGIPSTGTGLVGQAFAPGTNIWNIELARAAALGAANATFTATELLFGSKRSDTSLTEFLGDAIADVVEAQVVHVVEQQATHQKFH